MPKHPHPHPAIYSDIPREALRTAYLTVEHMLSACDEADFLEDHKALRAVKEILHSVLLLQISNTSGG